MNFGQAVASVFSQYATFSGRASRSEYWWFYLFAVLGSLVTGIVDAALDATIGFSFIRALFSLAILVPSLAVYCRRLHDSGRSGWWLLWLAIGYLVAIGFAIGGGIGLFVAGFSDSGSSSGAFAVFGILLVIGLVGMLALVITSIVLLTQPSQPGPNQYGDHPLWGPRAPGAGWGAPGPYGYGAPQPSPPYGAPGQPPPYGPTGYPTYPQQPPAPYYGPQDPQQRPPG